MTKYVADIQIEVELKGAEDSEDEAFKVVDNILQRAWDTDQGRAWLAKNWHFEMTEGCVRLVVDELPDGVTS